jgi:hypothetical protein
VCYNISKHEDCKYFAASFVRRFLISMAIQNELITTIMCDPFSLPSAQAFRRGGKQPMYRCPKPTRELPFNPGIMGPYQAQKAVVLQSRSPQPGNHLAEGNVKRNPTFCLILFYFVLLITNMIPIIRLPFQCEIQPSANALPNSLLSMQLFLSYSIDKTIFLPIISPPFSLSNPS